MAEHDDGVDASCATPVESLSNKLASDALPLKAGRNCHRCQPKQPLAARVLDGNRREKDVPHQVSADLGDECDDRRLRPVQGFDDVGLLASAERAFVHEAHRVPVA